MMRKLLLCTLLLFSANRLPAVAQGFSYVYIQGDGETPFYVKLEGEMQPRYGTNYSILSRLAPGPANIEILFQQNKFPVQKFALQVPAGGARSLLLVRKEAIFLLYDLQQGFYIPEGNAVADDKYVAGTTGAQSTALNATSGSVLQERNKESNRTPPVRETASTPPAKTEIPAGNDPAFIPDLELSRKTPNRIPKANVETPVRNTRNLPEPAPAGEGCAVPMSISQFGDFYGRFLQQPSLDAKLTFLLDAEECPTPDQARIVARSLDTEPARLRYLGRVIRRAPKKKPFGALSNVFEDPQNQKALRELVQP